MLPTPLTLVHLLNARAEHLKDLPALWQRRSGRWEATSWRQYAQRVRQASLGLLALRFAPRQVLLVVGSNREAWLVGTLAAMAVGGVAVAVDPSSGPEVVASTCARCRPSAILVEGPELLAALMPSLARFDDLKHVILMDPAVQRRPGVVSFAELLELGEAGDDADFYANLHDRRGDEVAQLVAATPGGSSAAMLTHRSLAWTAAQLALSLPTSEADRLLSVLSLASPTEQLFSLQLPLVSGVQVFLGRGLELVHEDLLAVRPSILTGDGSLWGRLRSIAEQLMASQRGPRRLLLERARPLARQVLADRRRHQPLPLGLKGRHELARRLILSPLKARLGLDRGRVLLCRAPGAAHQLAEFFASIDVEVAGLWGPPESGGVASFGTAEATRPGAQGRPMLGVEVRVAEDGELLLRGENVCAGFYRDEDSSARRLTDGWLHTGVKGALDEDGYVSLREVV